MSDVASKAEEFTFKWSIQNISYCDQKIYSPFFTVEAFHHTRWRIKFHPNRPQAPGSIGVWLCRSKDDGGQQMQITFSRSVLTSNNECYGKVTSVPFLAPRSEDGRQISEFGISTTLKRDDLFGWNKQALLPNDTLTLICCIVQGKGERKNVGRCRALTRFDVERKSFLWKIEQTINLPIVPEKEEVKVFSGVHKEPLVNISLLREDRKIVKIKIVINKQNKKKCFTYSLHLLSSDDQQKLLVKCQSISDTKQIDSFDITLPPIVEDTLSLLFEFARSDGKVDLNEIIEEHYGEELKDHSQALPTLQGDLFSIYNAGTLCDKELKTNTKIFPVHTCVLSARSPVFHAMFTTDMKEKNKKCVPLSHLDESTVSKMLKFIYHDTVEDLDWNSAVGLYKAADEYQILPLKKKCADFLKNHLSNKNACRALELADLHHDGYFKNGVQKFIKANQNIILVSEHWKQLEKGNAKLIIETFHEIFKS